MPSTRMMYRSAAAACVGGCAFLAPAQARTIALSCYLMSQPEFVSTFYVDLDRKTVTTTAHSSPTNRQMQTYPAEITDRTIRWWSGNRVLGTLDRYSGIYDAGAGFRHKCQVVTEPAIK